MHLAERSTCITRSSAYMPSFSAACRRETAAS